MFPAVIRLEDRQVEVVKGLITPQLDRTRNDLTAKRIGNRTANEKDLNRVRTRLQGEWRSVATFSVEPGEIGLTALEEAGDGIDQGAKGRLAQLAAGLTQG